MRLALAVLLAAACTSADGRPPAKAKGTVVVELFTSQGCSSCPPADRLLSELVRGEHPVLALAFHVDYWDDLGWADPFSRAAYSDRQRAYAGDDGRVYTPALVVNGTTDVVGSQRKAVARAIAEATPLPGLAAKATVDGDTLRVEAAVAAGTTAVVAVYEDALITDIPRGENAGEKLRNDRVVRALVPITGRATIALDPTWQRPHLGAVVLAAGPDRRLVAAQPLAF
jgi:hypothetical protein